MMKHLFPFVFSITFFVACSSTEQQNTIDSTDGAAAQSETLPATLLNEPVRELVLPFGELSVKVKGTILQLINDEREINEDTVVLELELGADIGDVQFSVFTNQLQQLKVEQSMLTSMSISAEGPHCDLEDWKHYHSPWTSVKQTNTEHFQLATYTVEENKRFPDVSLDEIKNAAKQHCGKDWFETINKITAVDDAWCYVSLSKVYVRISGSKNSSTPQVEKILEIRIPMGC